MLIQGKSLTLTVLLGTPTSPPFLCFGTPISGYRDVMSKHSSFVPILPKTSRVPQRLWTTEGTHRRGHCTRGLLSDTLKSQGVPTKESRFLFRSFRSNPLIVLKMRKLEDFLAFRKNSLSIENLPSWYFKKRTSLAPGFRGMFIVLCEDSSEIWRPRGKVYIWSDSFHLKDQRQSNARLFPSHVLREKPWERSWRLWRFKDKRL